MLTLGPHWRLRSDERNFVLETYRPGESETPRKDWRLVGYFSDLPLAIARARSQGGIIDLPLEVRQLLETWTSLTQRTKQLEHVRVTVTLTDGLRLVANPTGQLLLPPVTEAQGASDEQWSPPVTEELSSDSQPSPTANVEANTHETSNPANTQETNVTAHTHNEHTASGHDGGSVRRTRSISPSEGASNARWSPLDTEESAFNIQTAPTADCNANTQDSEITQASETSGSERRKRSTGLSGWLSESWSCAQSLRYVLRWRVLQRKLTDCGDLAGLTDSDLRLVLGEVAAGRAVSALTGEPVASARPRTPRTSGKKGA